MFLRFFFLQISRATALNLNLGRRFARSGRCLKPPDSLLATDRSKAVVLV